MKKKMHGSVGEVPRPKGGTGKALDHGSVGKLAKGSDKTNISPTSFAAGHPPHMCGGNKQTNPQKKVKVHAQGPQKV